MNRNMALMNALSPPEPLPTVSLEAIEVADGVTRVETEIEIYGTMRNMDDLTKAKDWEIQEQWGLYVPQTDKNAGSGNTRVRLTQNSSGATSYVLTTKVKQAGGNQECEEISSVDMFNLFKKLGDSGLRKKRYFFPMEGTEMCFEVDVFFNAAGTMIPQVKIDLEIKGQLPENFDYSNITLPFEMSDIRIISPGRKNDEDLAYVRKLFSEHYDIPNQYKASAVSQESVGQVSMEEMAPPGCICGKCGWGDSCPGQAEKRRLADERDAAASTDNLDKNKEALVDLADRCSSMAGVLSYNDTRREAALKSSLKNVTNNIQCALLNKGSDADTFHSDLKAKIALADGDHEFR